MITTNINGQPLSQAFIDQIQDDSPNVIARLMLDGSEISATIVSVTVEKGACGESDFSIGNVVATKLTATLKDLTTPLKGKEVEYQLGAWTGSDYEYISICKVTVSEARQTRYQTEITAYSSVVSDTTDTLDTSNLPSNPTIADIATAVASQINRTITFDTSIDTTQIVMASIGSIALYQVLQIIAICSGGYIINTNDNNIKVCRFDSTPTLTVNTGMMVNLPQIEEQPFFVSGVYCLVQEESEDNDGNVIPAIEYKETITQIVAEDNGTYTLVFSDGSTMRGVGADDALVNLAFESKYITNDIFNANIKGILGYEYYPATIDLTLGDPRLEGCDVLSVLELDGNYYTVPCHRLTHKYSGGFTSEVVAVNATAESDDVGTVPPITSMLQGVKKDVVKAQTVADEAQTIARNNAQYFWFLESDPDDTGVGTGAHITETPKETFMQDPSNGGGNLLARSNGIAIRDGLTELAIFGADGARVGQQADNHINIVPDKFSFNSDDTEIARITGEKVIVSSIPRALKTDFSSIVDDTECTLSFSNSLYGSAKNAFATLSCGGTIESGDSFPYAMVDLNRSEVNARCVISANYTDEKYGKIDILSRSNSSTITLDSDDIQIYINSSSTDTTSPDYKLYHALSDMGWT